VKEKENAPEGSRQRCQNRFERPRTLRLSTEPIRHLGWTLQQCKNTQSRTTLLPMPWMDSLQLGKAALLFLVHIVLIGKLKIGNVKREKLTLEIVLMCMGGYRRKVYQEGMIVFG